MQGHLSKSILFSQVFCFWTFPPNNLQCWLKIVSKIQIMTIQKLWKEIPYLQVSSSHNLKIYLLIYMITVFLLHSPIFSNRELNSVPASSKLLWNSMRLQLLVEIGKIFTIPTCTKFINTQTFGLKFPWNKNYGFYASPATWLQHPWDHAARIV